MTQRSVRPLHTRSAELLHLPARGPRTGAPSPWTQTRWLAMDMFDVAGFRQGVHAEVAHPVCGLWKPVMGYRLAQ